jgi:hypothetical protein
MVATLVALVLLALLTGSSSAQVGYDPIPPIEAVPRADCGPGSKEETGLQGQIPQADRDSGRSLKGYRCNLELVGRWQHGEGASWQHAWYDDCAYYGTLMGPERKTKQGAVVVDASNPRKPKETAVLQSPAVMDPHESLKVNEKRGLLAAVNNGDPDFDVYDVSDDCAHPRLLATVRGDYNGHEGEWAPDGRTYWGSDISGTYYAIDVTDPRKPKQIATYAPGSAIHGLSISDDGTRGYFTVLEPTGFVIADLSEVQDRVPDPQIREISRIHWADGAFGQHTIPVTIGGDPYIIHVDEAGRGAARIVDISNEQIPVVVSKLKLEVHLPQNEPLVAEEWGTNGIFVYDAHYCSVDKRHEPSILACGYFESGVRVFDIRDPVEPKEIAYYMPPAIVDKPLPGSSHGGGTADRCAAQVRIVKKTGQLWTTCQDNEFMILRFTNDTWPFRDQKDAGRRLVIGDRRQ